MSLDDDSPSAGTLVSRRDVLYVIWRKSELEASVMVDGLWSLYLTDIQARLVQKK